VLFLGSLGISVAGTALSAISAAGPHARTFAFLLLLLPHTDAVLVVSATVTVGLLEREPIIRREGDRVPRRLRRSLLTALWLSAKISLEE